MQRLSALRDEQTTWSGLETQLTSLAEIQELIEATPDPEIAAEVATTLDAIDAHLVKLRLGLLLQGPHDESDAILTLHVGNGGVDAQDFVDMMLRMYLRW